VDFKRSVIVLFFICLYTALAAQKPHIYGKVMDGETHSGLPNVNISFTGTRTGCTTDPQGDFSIYPDTIPAYMIISHLGYEPQRIWLEKEPAGLNILMKPVAKMLQEVEIKARSEPVPFFKDNQYAVLDYEVDNTLVYLLIYRFRLAKSELICMSDQGDTIARSGQLWFKPGRIIADCLGYLHVLSADSSYQVFLRKDTIIFPFKANIAKFLSTMSDCVTSTGDFLIFREESYDHQTVDFYRIHRKSGNKEYFATARDEAKLKMLRKNPVDRYLLSMDTIPGNHAEMVEWVWVNKILYKPNASVLKKIGDTLAIFNTTDGSLDLYNADGIFLEHLKITLPEKGTGDWTKEIYFDQITHKPYISLIKNGKINFYSIQLSTGELNFILTTVHIFPQKINIHHDCLFYLYDLPGTGDNKHLFRQKI
jgi:hypothetical protein